MSSNVIYDTKGDSPQLTYYICRDGVKFEKRINDTTSGFIRIDNNKHKLPDIIPQRDEFNLNLCRVHDFKKGDIVQIYEQNGPVATKCSVEFIPGNMCLRLKRI